jgi:hypothetical protein
MGDPQSSLPRRAQLVTQALKTHTFMHRGVHGTALAATTGSYQEASTRRRAQRSQQESLALRAEVAKHSSTIPAKELRHGRSWLPVSTETPDVNQTKLSMAVYWGAQCHNGFTRAKKGS